jgi:deoxyribose-phosphate aldolase
MRRAALAAAIDHTLLRATATAAQIEALCREAHEHGFFSVCVQPCRVALARRTLTTLAASTRVCTVIGFPLGANQAAIKAAEARLAVSEGAHELDVVINIGLLRDGAHTDVVADLTGVVAAAEGRLVKVILETALLTPEEIDLACRLAVEAGAGFVKTSTGFGPGGATVAAVERMRRAVGPHIGVKASGGVGDAATARAMLAAGANRLGASASLAILAGWDHDAGRDHDVPANMSGSTGYE